MVIEDNTKSVHVTVCSVQLRDPRSSLQPPDTLPLMRAEASSLPCRVRGLQPQAPSRCPARLLGGGGQILCPSWGKVGERARFPFLPWISLGQNTSVFCFLIPGFWDPCRRRLSESRKRNPVPCCFLLSWLTAACAQAARAWGFGEASLPGPLGTQEPEMGAFAALRNPTPEGLAGSAPTEGSRVIDHLGQSGETLSSVPSFPPHILQSPELVHNPEIQP